MDERNSPLDPIQVLDLHVTFDEGIHAGTLHYFQTTGDFQFAIAATLGVPLPGVLKAVVAPADSREGASVLAWRSPTETLLLCESGTRFDRLKAACSAVTGGRFIDQSDGLCVLRARGGRTRDLLLRVGTSDSVPALGDAKRSRVAEVSVLALKVCSEDTLLVVNREYREHLMNWILETAVDLDSVRGPSP